jgi:hypothetical protein
VVLKSQVQAISIHFRPKICKNDENHGILQGFPWGFSAPWNTTGHYAATTPRHKRASCWVPGSKEHPLHTTSKVFPSSFLAWAALKPGRDQLILQQP